VSNTEVNFNIIAMSERTSYKMSRVLVDKRVIKFNAKSRKHSGNLHPTPYSNTS